MIHIILDTTAIISLVIPTKCYCNFSLSCEGLYLLWLWLFSYAEVRLNNLVEAFCLNNLECRSKWCCEWGELYDFISFKKMPVFVYLLVTYWSQNRGWEYYPCLQTWQWWNINWTILLFSLILYLVSGWDLNLVPDQVPRHAGRSCEGIG